MLHRRARPAGGPGPYPEAKKAGIFRRRAAWLASELQTYQIVKEAVFYDLDNTLVSAETEKVFAVHLLSRGVATRRDLLRIAWFRLQYWLRLYKSFEEAKRKLVKVLLAGKEAERCFALYREIFASTLQELVRPGFREIVEAHRKRGRLQFIVSSNSDFIARSFCELLGLDGFLASRLEIAGGLFTGNVLGPIYAGHGKAEAARLLASEHDLDLSASHAYGDYFEDRHILGAVGHPIAVHPDRKLRKLARKNGWPILEASR